MKILYNSPVFVIGFAIFSSLFSQCTNSQENNKKSSYTQVMVKVSHDSQFQPSDMNRLLDILNSRIKTAEYTAEIKPIGDSLLDVSIYGTIDTLLIRKIFSNGQLQFWELYSFSELAKKNCFVDIEKAFNESRATTDQGSNNLSYYTNKKNLYDHINFSVGHNGKVYNVGPVGIVNKEDTAFMKEFLESPAVKKILPSDLVWVYGIPGSETVFNDVIPLYALKTYGSDTSKLGNEDILNVNEEHDSLIKISEVNIIMNKKGAKIWADMTAQNVGKFIAITMDNLVYSCPRISDKIENGISSVFVNDELKATEFADILMAGRPPALMSVLSIKKISKE